MNLATLRISVLIFVLCMAACQTLPSDAPHEFHSAKSSIDQLNRQKVDKHFPQTVKRANNYYDEALTMLRVTQNQEDNKKSPARHQTGIEREQTTDFQTNQEAINKANQAKETADGALALHSKILSWDAEDSGLKDALATFEPPVIHEPMTIEVESGANLDQNEIISTVAFFNTNKADKPIYKSKEMESLVEVLKKDPSWQVELVGYADPRGPDKINDKLAEQRAKTVANDLINRGISESQITFKGGSVSDDRNDEYSRSASNRNDPKHLLLDRRVQAKLFYKQDQTRF